MTLRKTTAAVVMTAALLCAALAYADEGAQQTLTLELLSGGRLASEVTNNYILRIPSDFSVKQKGWNEIGSIDVSVSEDKYFNTEKKVVVSATSANEFKLKDGTNEIGYILTTAEGGTQTTEFTFAAADINSGTASQDLGISLTWESTQAAGTYTDTLTYTGEVQDAAATATFADALTEGAVTVITATISGDSGSVSDGQTVVITLIYNSASGTFTATTDNDIFSAAVSVRVENNIDLQLDIDCGSDGNHSEIYFYTDPNEYSEVSATLQSITVNGTNITSQFTKSS